MKDLQLPGESPLQGTERAALLLNRSAVVKVVSAFREYRAAVAGLASKRLSRKEFFDTVSAIEDGGGITLELEDDAVTLFPVALFPKCLDCNRISTRVRRAGLPQHRDQYYCDEHPKDWSGSSLAQLVATPWAQAVKKLRPRSPSP